MTARPRRLTVWMAGRPVATLSRTRERLGLAYTDEALALHDLNTPLLSTSLPVGPRACRHNVVQSFFEGLLPEGETRRMLAYDFRLREDDTFGLLEVLGRDCAGALVILPEGEALPDPEAHAPVVLTRDELIARLRRLDVEPLGIDGQLRVSLAGVQRKLVLSLLASGEWALPVNGLPSTHILKRGDPRFPGMVANEAFCLAVARHLGLPAVDASLLDAPDPILVVTRYDRVRRSDGTVERLHQEDLAQALGISPGAKYEDRGGPGLLAVARLLRDWTTGAGSLEGLLDLTLLNVGVGNGDAHAKNLSLLHEAAGTLRLAPAYDVLSTAFYPQADVRPGMYVHGQPSIHAITASDVVAEAVSWGLPPARTAARVEELLRRLPSAIAMAAREVPAAPEALVELVVCRASALAEGRAAGAAA